MMVEDLQKEREEKTYKNGLVIGKFLPLHFGHIHLIDYALKACECLTVALVVKPTDPIPLEVRLSWFTWLRETGRNICVEVVDEPLPQTAQLEEEAARIWTLYFANRFKGVDCLFSSEAYGDILADEMAIAHRHFDVNRDQIQISGTEIRQDPKCHQNYLPEPVKCYYEAIEKAKFKG